MEKQEWRREPTIGERERMSENGSLHLFVSICVCACVIACQTCYPMKALNMSQIWKRKQRRAQGWALDEKRKGRENKIKV